MVVAKFDNRELNRILNNSVKYSNGFLDGVDAGQIIFMNRLGQFVADALGQYIDAQARANPEKLHHVYEWSATGSMSARLFDFDVSASKEFINISGKFLPSRSIAENSSEPFVDKAYIMENQISVTISPKNSEVLVFESDGETVFTVNDIYIANPGGDGVANGFGSTVDFFFSNFFTNALLRPFMKKISTPEEFSQFFAQGTKSGYPVGMSAGQKYITSVGVILE